MSSSNPSFPRERFPEAANHILEVTDTQIPQIPLFINISFLKLCVQASYSVPVFWGHFSIVEAELICLRYYFTHFKAVTKENFRDLLATNVSWKYAIDVAGSEQVGPLSQKATILVEVYPFFA